MNKKSTDLVVEERSSPSELINLAIEKGVDLDKLEKLLILKERWEANEAKKAFNKAMAAFKENPPSIEKDKKVGYKTDKGFVGYSHASLSNVVDEIAESLSTHGLSASWRTNQTDKISVTCVITHIAGHTEETTLSAGADKSGSKNDIQALGSTITYLQRYSLLAILGLATHDMDSDGQIPSDKISAEQVSELHKRIKEIGISEEKFLNYMKIEKMEDILSDDYKKGLAAIEAQRRANQSKGMETQKVAEVLK